MAPLTLLVVDEPFAVDPSGLVGADGPVAGVDGDALGRDILRGCKTRVVVYVDLDAFPGLSHG